MAVHRRRKRLLDASVEARGLERFMVVGLYRANGVNGLVGLGGDVGDAALRRAGEPPHPTPQDKDGQHDQRHAKKDDAGKLDAGDEEQDESAHHQHQIAHGPGQRCSDDPLQDGGVGGEPRQ